MFQPLRGLRSKSGEWGLFLGLRGTPCLVLPRASHLMLTDVPPQCLLYPTGSSPLPKDSSFKEEKSVATAAPLVSAAPRAGLTPPPHLLGHRRVKHACACRRDRPGLALLLIHSSPHSASFLCLLPNPAVASIGKASLLLCCCCLQVYVLVFCLCVCPFSSPCGSPQPLLALMLPPHHPACPGPQAKAQASSGQGGSCGHPAPQLKLQMFPLVFPPTQSLCFPPSPRRWDCGHRTVEARDLRARHMRSLAKDALGQVAGGQPMVDCQWGSALSMQALEEDRSGQSSQVWYLYGFC